VRVRADFVYAKKPVIDIKERNSVIHAMRCRFQRLREIPNNACTETVWIRVLDNMSFSHPNNHCFNSRNMNQGVKMSVGGTNIIMTCHM